MNKKRNILVTGGAGFIGSSLVKRLTTDGHVVSVIDNLWRGRIENLQNSDGRSVIDLAIQFHHADLTNYGECEKLIRDYDVVYHLADIVGGIQYVFGNQLYVFRQNMLINTNVLTACLHNNVKNYVYVGTACSYPKSLQMQEGIVSLREEQAYPAEPESAYGWSKLMGEYEAELAQQSGKINVAILRLHNVYGPGSSMESFRSQVIPALMAKAIRYPKQPFIVWGSGRQYRDFIFVDDVVEALVQAWQRGLNQGVVQIGSGIPTTIRQLAEMIVKLSGKDIEIHYDVSKPEGDRGRISVIERARRVLDWKPQYSISDGLTLSYEWAKRNFREENADAS
jgi:GDP-D-mannose 3',5'-epimerase